MSLSKDFFASLGMISVNFQHLEAYVDFFIWGLVGEDQTIGKIITANKLSFETKLAILASLLRYRTSDSKLIDRLDEILKRASSSSDKRNTVIHSIYLTSELEEPEEIVTRFKTQARRRTGLQHQFEDINQQDLKKAYQEIAEIAKDLLTLMKVCLQKRIISLPQKM